MVAFYLCYLPLIPFFSPLSPYSDVGFEIPNLFVVGYALDYNEYFRDLNVSHACKSLASCSQEFNSYTNETNY